MEHTKRFPSYENNSVYVFDIYNVTNCLLTDLGNVLLCILHISMQTTFICGSVKQFVILRVGESLSTKVT